MSLISCPECSSEISDKVKSCPHCGYPFEENVGSQISQTSSEGPIRDEVNKKKSYYVIGALILFIAMAYGGYSYYREQQVKEYGKKLDAVISEMYSSASSAEEVSITVVKTWFNYIWEPEAPETWKYIMVNGKPASEDNAVLNAIFADSALKETVADISVSQVKVSEMMEQLNNPPKEYKSSYSALLELNKAYLEWIDVALNPIRKSDMGYELAYKQYSDLRVKKVDAFISIYKVLQAQLPNK